MTINTGVFYLILGLLANFRSVSGSLETVWLKDVTTRFLTDKQTLCYPELPKELTFHLQRGSDIITLSLKRNHHNNPDVYYVRRLKNGRSALLNRRNLGKEDVGYYQDEKNGAFMTVRYVKRSNDQCDRVINGHIQIGDRSYNLRPAETDVASRSVLEVPDLLGMQYVLQDQDHIDRHNSVQNKDAAHVDKKEAEQDLIARFLRFEGQHKQIHFPHPDATSSSRNVANLHSRGETDQSRQLKEIYDVEVAVLIDSEIWDLYSSTVEFLNPFTRDNLVERKIRQAYSHIMNGVNLRYKGIEDPNLSITVTLSAFIFFKRQRDFPHRVSKVKIENGTKYIDAVHYIEDLCKWDEDEGVNHLPPFDHAMLFTRYQLYIESFNNTRGGLTFTGHVCEPCGRTSIAMSGDFPIMVGTAVHELGHNLGADHDGEGNSVDCKAEDLFIMTPVFSAVESYSKNRYIFSNCSVQAFKDTLKDKQCVTNKGIYYNEQEYKEFVKKWPGEVYTLDEQCHLIIGPGSVNCKFVAADVCRFMRCTDPKTQICIDEYFSAATGTECGRNMKCIKRLCVSKLELNALK